MKMGVISIRDMLKAMKSDAVFSMRVVQYDAQRKKGGKVVEYREAVQLNAKGRAARGYTPDEAKKARAAKHRDRYTRNIAICADGHPTSMIRKIHPALVLEFNNKKVVP